MEEKHRHIYMQGSITCRTRILDRYFLLFVSSKCFDTKPMIDILIPSRFDFTIQFFRERDRPLTIQEPHQSHESTLPMHRSRNVGSTTQHKLATPRNRLG